MMMTLAQTTFFLSESERVETEPHRQVFAFVLLCLTVCFLPRLQLAFHLDTISSAVCVGINLL